MKRALALTLMTLLLAALPAAAADTSIERAVSAGQRLEVRNYDGQVDVSTWDQDRVRVEAEHNAEEDIVVELRGSTLLVVPASWEPDSGAFALDLPDKAVVKIVGRTPPAVDLKVTVPAWMPVLIETPQGEVSVAGTQAAVEVTTMTGDIRVRGGRSRVHLTSMIGHLDLEGASGHLIVEATMQPVTVRSCVGDLRVETTRGDIVLEELEVTDLEVTTIGGDITLRGPLAPAGRYQLSSHRGDLRLEIAGDINAAFSVRAFRGEFASDLVPPGGVEDGRGDFTLGDGSARLRLESFSGTVDLRRAP